MLLRVGVSPRALPKGEDSMESGVTEPGVAPWPVPAVQLDPRSSVAPSSVPEPGPVGARS